MKNIIIDEQQKIEMEEFLNKIHLEIKNDINNSSQRQIENLIYHELCNYELKASDFNESGEALSNEQFFIEWDRRFHDREDIFVNTEFARGWCIFRKSKLSESRFSFNSNDWKGHVSHNRIKIYVPLDYEHLYEGANMIFDYIASLGIIHNSKISNSVRTDNIVIRINPEDEKYAYDLINFINSNEYLKSGLNKLNPFLPSINGIGIMLDNGKSFNKDLSKTIYSYIKDCVNNGDKVSFEDFSIHMAETNYYLLNAGFGSKMNSIMHIKSSIINSIKSKDIDFAKYVLGCTPQLSNDIEFLKQLVMIDNQMLVLLGDDYETVKYVVNINGTALQYASKRLQDDDDIVKIAVSNDSDALRYASERLKDNDEIVKIAVSKKGNTLQYASERLQDDDDIVKIAVSNDSDALRYASKRLQDNYEIVKLAVSKDGKSLKYASERLQDDDDIVKIAITNSDVALKYASIRLRNNEEIVKLAMKNDCYAFCFSGESIFNKNFILSNIELFDELPYLLNLFDEEMLNDIDIINAAVSSAAWEEFCTGPGMDDMYATILEMNGMFLKYFTKVQNSEYHVLLAVQNNGYALQFASEELKDNEDIVDEARESIRMYLKNKGIEVSESDLDCIIRALKEANCNYDFDKGRSLKKVIK